mmetsp:Transcript_71380/g.127319  ORF Transcript_71380/g.127319 Transcript_71380/m.127319 type:complete len:295 (+) Transcript_71380:110-994(+)
MGEAGEAEAEERPSSAMTAPSSEIEASPRETGAEELAIVECASTLSAANATELVPYAESTISKPLQFPKLGAEESVEVLAHYPDTPAGRWCAKRPQVGLVNTNGDVEATGCIDDVVIQKGPDCPVMRQGGERPVFSTAGYEAFIADIAEKHAEHKSGMTPMEEKIFREYPEAYDEIKDMVVDAGILSPSEEMEQVEKMKSIIEKWKNVYKERIRRREDDLKQALGAQGYKNRKSTARRKGMGTKAYEDQVLAKIYAAENESLRRSQVSKATAIAVLAPETRPPVSPAKRSSKKR